MAKPTHEDAELVIQLAQFSSTPEMIAAYNFISSDKFVRDGEEFFKRYPRGSAEYSQVALMLGLLETVGTLHKYGLINDDLLFDWLGVELLWERIKGVALADRDSAHHPALWENAEALARDGAAWSQAHQQAPVPAAAHARRSR